MLVGTAHPTDQFGGGIECDGRGPPYAVRRGSPAGSTPISGASPRGDANSYCIALSAVIA
jgi:hypothetical protein